MRLPTTSRTLGRLTLVAALGACDGTPAARDDAARAPGAGRGAAAAGGDSIGADDSIVPAAPASGTELGDSTRVIRLGAFRDAARAAALRDSLGAEGWTAWITTGGGWSRVNLPARDDARLRTLDATLRALRAAGLEAAVARDRAPAQPAEPWRVEVPPLAQGMVTEIRWTTSPDTAAFILVMDPVSVEAEPVPDLYVVGDERAGGGYAVHPHVWDVSPSPDWRRVAAGDAFLVSARERDSLSTAQWRALAAQLRLPVDSVRALAFEGSGMAVAVALALPHVAPLGRPCVAGAAPACARGAPAGAGGWRARWTADGRRVAFGHPPRAVNDQSPSPAWTLVDAATGRAEGTTTDTSGFAPVRWTAGPSLDYGQPVPMTEAVTLRLAGGATVTGKGGFVRVTRRLADGRHETRVLGPGRPLVATRSGRYVAALVPWLGAREYEVPLRLAVYAAP